GEGGDDGVPGAAKNTGDDACPLFYPSPASEGGIRKNRVALAAAFWLYPPAFPVGVKRPYKAAILDAPGTGGSVRSARTNQNRRLSDHD
ncbi:MAG: hypothetical protein WA743_13455, partial [Pseudolabrys sp.]